MERQADAATMRDVILDLPARAENVGMARRAVGSLSQAAGMSTDAVADVVLAVGEACANIVTHAYRDAPAASDRLLLRGRVVDRALEITIRDHGQGMAPRTDSPGLGLGLPLMATLAERLH